MSHAILTVDRGDRKPMYDQCLWQVSRFVSSYDDHIQVTRPPINSLPDLKDRMEEGFEIAKSKGTEWLLVVESDDFYPTDYLHKCLLKTDTSDFIGCEFSYYYNIRERTWERLYHPNRSSLYTTAFRVSAMLDFDWKRAHKLFLDIDIWKHARKYRRTFIDAGAIGIKGHGFGITGGKGHVIKLKNKDPDLSWLASKVDSHSLEFYKSLAL